MLYKNQCDALQSYFCYHLCVGGFYFLLRVSLALFCEVVATKQAKMCDLLLVDLVDCFCFMLTAGTQTVSILLLFLLFFSVLLPSETTLKCSFSL